MNIEIIEGKKLPQEDALAIMQILANTFGDGRKIDPEKKILFKNQELYFILRNNNEIVTVGCLKSLILKFCGEDFPIKGISGVVSIFPGKGYGKILMDEMRHYLKKKDFMAIGFCTRKNIPFYRKCNFSVKENMTEKFILRDKEGSPQENPDKARDLLFFNDKYSLIPRLASDPEATVTIPFWW